MATSAQAAPSLAREFRDLAQRFRAVQAATPVDAMRYVRRLEAAGARLLKRGHDDGLLLEDWDIGWLTDVDREISLETWCAQWRAVGCGLRKSFPERFPADLGLLHFEPAVKHDGTLETRNYSAATGPLPDEWHALAQEDAWLCDCWAGELEAIDSTEPAKKRAKGQGRRVEYDPAEDKQTYQAWAMKKHTTYHDLGLALGKSAREVRLALDRHRKWSKKCNRAR